MQVMPEMLESISQCQADTNAAAMHASMTVVTHLLDVADDSTLRHVANCLDIAHRQGRLLASIDELQAYITVISWSHGSRISELPMLTWIIIERQS